MVAAVPKAVPVRTERRQLSRKVMSRKTAGRMALAAKGDDDRDRARLPPQSREQTDEKEIEQYIFGGAYAGDGRTEGHPGESGPEGGCIAGRKPTRPASPKDGKAEENAQ